MLMNNTLKFKDETVELVEVVDVQMKSRTQSIQTLIIRKDGQEMVSIQKWWRKSAEQPWEEGKGFHFDKKEAVLYGHLLGSVASKLS